MYVVTGVMCTPSPCIGVGSRLFVAVRPIGPTMGRTGRAEAGVADRRGVLARHARERRVTGVAQAQAFRAIWAAGIVVYLLTY